MKTQIEVTKAELDILLRGAESEWRHWEDAHYKCEQRGWRDDKEKDRVVTYRDQAWQLVYRLRGIEREMLALAAVIVDTHESL